MKRPFICAAFLVMVLVGMVEAGPPTYNAYLYPVIARNAGAGGSNWATEVCSTNFHHSETLTVYFFFMQDGAAQFFIEDIPPEKTLCYEDIVQQALGQDDWQGAMIVTPDPDLTYDWLTFRLVTRVKVYNTQAGRTYGLNIAPEIDHFGIGEPIHFYFDDGSDDDLFIGAASGIDNYGTAGVDGYRSSIGYFNGGVDPDTGELTVSQEVRFAVFDRQGNLVYVKDQTVPPLKQGQFKIPSNVVVRGGWVKMFVYGNPDDVWGAPGRDFYGYLTVTDNLSGDGVYTPIQLPYQGDWDSYKKSSGGQDSYFRKLVTGLRKIGTRIERPEPGLDP